MCPRVVSGLTFFPRGGSSHVVRSLASALPAHGWDVTVVSGSARGHGEAHRFFAGLDVRPLDFTAALDAPEPLLADPPLHPSYEDRTGAPDRVFARVDDATYEHQVVAWSRALEGADAAGADVLHLHHLTPLHEAAARVAPRVPVVVHLHGTELLMLEEVEAGPPPGWDHAAAWAERMRGWAQRAQRIVLLSDSQVQRAVDLLDIDPERCVVLPNGFDPELFQVSEHPDPEGFWRRWLVELPRGWRPGGDEGSVWYSDRELEPLRTGPVVLYVGRFTRVKRVDLLIRAWARAERDGGALVLVGGHPGEWEGRHPVEVVEDTGAGDVFLAGWHDHDALPGFLAASDVLALASVREQFGQVLVEAMACAVPPVAVAAYGPGEIVENGETGWLVAPDDEEALAGALAEACGDAAERRRRGESARRVALERYAWPAIAGRLAEVFCATSRVPAR